MKCELDHRIRNGLKVTDCMIAIAVVAGGGLIGSGVWLAGGSPSLALGASGAIWVIFMVLLLVLLYRRLLKQLAKQSYELRTLVSGEAENSYRQVEALMNLREELPVRTVLPSLRGWAISPDFAELLLTQMKTLNPVNVLECGSGVSTIVVATFLQKQGKGHVVSLEHDLRYVEASTKLISEHRLEGYATILYAPLVSYQCDGRECLWYDVSGLCSSDRFDFIVVDGPPSHTGEMARYPLFCVMADRIAQGATIILDDARRSDERKVLEYWSKDNPEASLSFVDAEKGAAIFKLPDI